MNNTGRPGGQAKARTAANMRMLAKVPRAPGYLNKAQAGIFKDTCRLLIDREMLSEGDLYLVESLAVSVADLRDCTQMVNEQGLVRTNMQGNLVPHPGMGLKKQLEQQLNQAAMALGLNPRARQQLMVQGRIEDVGKSGDSDHNPSAF